MDREKCSVEDPAFEKLKNFDVTTLQNKSEFHIRVRKNIPLQINALTLESTRAASHRNHARFYQYGNSIGKMLNLVLQ